MNDYEDDYQMIQIVGADCYLWGRSDEEEAVIMLRSCALLVISYHRPLFIS